VAVEAARSDWDALAGGLVRQVVEEGFGGFEVGGVETFGEPVVDVGEHRARFVATALQREQASEAGGGAQFP
jgi:hypothetical protein